MFIALIAAVITNQDYVFFGCYRLTDIYNICIYYAISLKNTMSVINKRRKLTELQCYPKRNPSGNTRKSWKNDNTRRKSCITKRATEHCYRNKYKM